jgi:hypothetical protein
MRGYPKYVATRQDFINLLEAEEFRSQALADLTAVYELDDALATRAVDLIDPENPEAGWNMEEIENPMPRWKQLGFESREAVADLIIDNGGEV